MIISACNCDNWSKAMTSDGFCYVETTGIRTTKVNDLIRVVYYSYSYGGSITKVTRQPDVTIITFIDAEEGLEVTVSIVTRGGISCITLHREVGGHDLKMTLSDRFTAEAFHV